MTDSQQLQAIYELLVEIRGELGGVRVTQDGQGKRLDDHEARIRAGERRRWPLPSLSILIAAGAMLVATIGLITGQG